MCRPLSPSPRSCCFWRPPPLGRRGCWWSSIRTSRSGCRGRSSFGRIRTRCRPTPPPMSYKIKELDVQARLIDQVAQVQVSQTFVNTGSQPMEVAFVFPLPYDGADRADDADDRRPRVSGQAARRQGSPADVRGDRAQEPRSGAAGMAGHGLVPHQRLSRCRPARAAPSRSAIRNSAASRKG